MSGGVPGELARLAGDGWLPVALDRAREMVVLAQVLDADWRARSFAAALAGRADRGVRLVPVSEFVGQVGRWASTPDTSAPGVVAHVGRCGSTLLANLLGLDQDVLMLKEPAFLHPARPELLRALIRYSQRVADGAGRRLLVKPTSWTGPALLDALGGRVRWLLLWRDPAEVVRSELARPPRWERSARAARELARRGHPEGEPDRAALFARHWAAVVTAFVAGPPVVPLRCLDYAALAADKPGSVRAARAWFGLDGARPLPDGFDTEAGRYSKTTGVTPFDPATSHPGLTPGDAARVDELTAPALASLRTGCPALVTESRGHRGCHSGGTNPTSQPSSS